MSNRSGPVVFYDSGVGGLPYLDQARRFLPELSFAYFADRAAFPYGTKDKTELIQRVLLVVEALKRQLDPLALVIACNTATELAIHEVRKAHPDLPVVGTVPAIKPAAAVSRSKRIAVVATERAVHDAYLLELAARWAADCQVERIGDSRLVDFVEHRFLEASEEERLAAVRPSVGRALKAGVDTIVLGCTHFLHLSQEFALAAGPEIQVVDSRTGVVDQLRRILETLSSEKAGWDKKGGPMMYLSGPEPFGTRYTSFASLYGLVPAGTLLP